MTPIVAEVGRRGPLAFDIDHVDPLGDHVSSNLRATHAFCNQSKSRDASDPEIVVARARLAYKLAKPTSKKATVQARFDGEDWRRRSGHVGWLRSIMARLGRQKTRHREADSEDRDEYQADVQQWADRLPFEAERYLAWTRPTENPSASME
jgi:hypothetical protein